MGVWVGGSGVLVGGGWVDVKDCVMDGCGLLVASVACPGVGVAGEGVQEARINTNITGRNDDR